MASVLINISTRSPRPPTLVPRPGRSFFKQIRDSHRPYIVSALFASQGLNSTYDYPLLFFSLPFFFTQPTKNIDDHKYSTTMSNETNSTGGGKLSLLLSLPSASYSDTDAACNSYQPQERYYLHVPDQLQHRCRQR